MKTRLQELMAREGLTAVKVAEIAGVQPSAVSHILSGRNHPGYDFITRLLQAYPNLNARWLLLGESNMYLDENIFVDASDPTSSDSKNIDNQQCNGSLSQSDDVVMVSSGSSTPALDAARAHPPQSANSTATNVNIETVPNIENKDITTERATSKKTLGTIVMFYDDGTFSAYQKE
ncbi:MAG: helix-turn-helix domain-containing protein [Rikenellaceae bacterium]|nr:helix-turn-helix domain-containing protein [Rikenellaceae bacterium]MCL2692379.1 helix-turn-helix domain-containing protein [Rikenellaceae bacterium]